MATKDNQKKNTAKKKNDAKNSVKKTQNKPTISTNKAKTEKTNVVSKKEPKKINSIKTNKDKEKLNLKKRKETNKSEMNPSNQKEKQVVKLFDFLKKIKIPQKKKKDKKKTKELKKLKDVKIEKKHKKLLMIIAIICGMIILVEVLLMISHRLEIEKSTLYYDMLNGIVVDDNNIVAVGQSDFKYSRKNEYTKNSMHAKIVKYDKNGKILFEKMYTKGTNSNFNNVISVEDGYIAVGSGVFSDKEIEEEGSEAIIVKYDKDGNLVWEKFYSVITATTFNKVLEVSDGYIAIGQSIYANMEMGNHTTGGGIIVKFDKNGKELWHNNHGGTKSGNFRDIVKVGDDFYVVGKDGTDSGNLVKYNKEGKYIWHKNYRYTDSIGFTGVAYLDNSLYIVGSKKILPEGTTDDDDRITDNTDCLLVKYDLEGKILFEKTFGGSSNERYNSVVMSHNNLYVIGHTTSRDAGLKITTDGKTLTGIIVRYDINGNILKKDVYGGSNNETLTDIDTDGISIYVSGYSNSKDGTIKTSHDNGKDYFGKVIKSNLKFKTMLVK